MTERQKIALNITSGCALSSALVYVALDECEAATRKLGKIAKIVEENGGLESLLTKDDDDDGTVVGHGCGI